MCCLVTTLFLIGPRAAIAVWWLLQPGRWQLAFHDMLVWPVLGLLFLPWTTLAYVVAAPAGTIVTGAGWVLVVLGLVVDVAGYAGGYGNRDRARVR